MLRAEISMVNLAFILKTTCASAESDMSASAAAGTRSRLPRRPGPHVCPDRLYRQQWRCLHFTSRLGMLLHPFQPRALRRPRLATSFRSFARSGIPRPTGLGSPRSLTHSTRLPVSVAGSPPSLGGMSKIPCLSAKCKQCYMLVRLAAEWPE